MTRSSNPLTNGKVGFWFSLLAVSGCVGTLQLGGLPINTPVMVPEAVPGAVIAADGYRLPLRLWSPDGPIRVLLLALHGFNDYSNAFAGIGPVLASRGILTCAYDQRGFGTTLNQGVWPGGATLRSDMETVAGLLQKRYPGVPMYLLGESMGGAVIMSALGGAVRPDSPLAAIKGAVLVAPAIWGRETMAAAPRIALWLANSLVPGLTLTTPRELKIHPSDNVEMLRAYSRDPLVIKATRVDSMNGLVELMGEALAAAPRFKTPALVMYGQHEEVLPKPAVLSLLERLPPGYQRISVYPDGWHMLLRDRHSDVTINDVVSWIDFPDTPLPSRADIEPLSRFNGRLSRFKGQ
ncbi:MAG: alpha/beta fold hydrolase [Rhodospirillaceae bacterium]